MQHSLEYNIPDKYKSKYDKLNIAMLETSKKVWKDFPDFVITYDPVRLPFPDIEYNPIYKLEDIDEKWVHVKSSPRNNYPSGIYTLGGYLVLLTKEHPHPNNINRTEYYIRYLYEGENIHDENLWAFFVYTQHNSDNRNPIHEELGNLCITKEEFISRL